MDREADYCALMSGLSELDFHGNAVPSDLVLIGDHAFPLSMNPRGQVLMAASRYGQGRIVVLAHEQYLTRFPRLVENALAWLMPSAGHCNTVGIQKNLNSLASSLCNCSIKTEVGDFQKDFAVYVSDAYSIETCAKDLVAFLKAGRGLLIAGQAWHWATSHSEENTLLNFPGNKVCSVAGIYFSEHQGELGRFPVPKQIPSSWLAVAIGKDFKDDLQFLLQGVSEFDISGSSLPSELLAHGLLAFPIALTPCGRAFIGGAYYGQGRVIVITHEGYLARESLSTFMINAIRWLDERRNGVIGVEHNVRHAHSILSRSGLKCNISGLKKDLSVFVCNSYNDAQSQEIQEFVAEGGGLLIGGHAWYWAQCNPHRNVMTECPGNRILNKMGISLMGDIVEPRVYKAQQLTQDRNKSMQAYSENQGELGRFPVPKQIPSSWPAVPIGKHFKDDLQFLLQGVSEFDISGSSLPSELIAHGPLAFPIALTPCERAFIGGAYYGQGRVIVITHEGYLARESLSTFMINAVCWLDEGRNGVIGVEHNVRHAHSILSRSGLKCNISGLKKYLSVFVCNSYNDAQSREIQEFVAEGGGLLIGGHAWYWAQCNPHRNVMTECPGNRILNKMGISLMGDIVEPGVYKAQQLTQDRNKNMQVYHFRDLLQRFAGHVIHGQQLSKYEQHCLNKLRHDCASYLQMQTHDCASYTSVVALLTDMVKKAGVPQVCQSCPIQSTKDKLLLHVGSELYKVCQNPDALLPFIIRDIPNLPSEPNARVCISANTADCEEWLSTGLYLSPGMKSNIAVPAEIVGKGWQVQIGCQTDYLGNADVLKRAPVVHERYPLDKEKVQVWNLWGGLIYLIAPPCSQVEGAEVVFQSVIKAPYYKSGETSVSDWVKEIRQAPAPWAELEFENLIITLQSDVIRQLDRPDEVAALWDTIMRGVAELASRPPKLPRKERFVVDVQISCGFMHAGYPIMMHSCSAPELVSPNLARRNGLWGAIHELGHNQQRSVWEFPPHTTECTCNLWSVYIHEEVLGINRANAHPNMTLAERQSRTQSYVAGGCELDQWEMWTSLETYMQLQEKFGWDAFKKVFAAYYNITNVPNDNCGKMNLYAETFSQVVNRNLASFFKSWGWPIQPATEEKLSILPEWSDHPMVQYG